MPVFWIFYQTFLSFSHCIRIPIIILECLAIRIPVIGTWVSHVKYWKLKLNVLGLPINDDPNGAIREFEVKIPGLLRPDQAWHASIKFIRPSFAKQWRSKIKPMWDCLNLIGWAGTPDQSPFRHPHRILKTKSQKQVFIHSLTILTFKKRLTQSWLYFLITKETVILWILSGWFIQ